MLDMTGAVFLCLAVALSLVYWLKGVQVIGMIAGLFWMIAGAYCYYLRGAAPSQAIYILAEMLGFFGVLGGIILAFVAGMDWSSDSKAKRAEREESERELTFDEQVALNYSEQPEDKTARLQQRQERLLTKAEKAQKRYAEGKD